VEPCSGQGGRARQVTLVERQATAGGYALVGEELKSRLAAQGEREEGGKPGPKRKPDLHGEPVSADLFGELAP